MMQGRRIAVVMLQWLMIMHHVHRRGLRTGWLSLVCSHPLLPAWPPRHRVVASLRSPRVTRPVAGWARGRLPPRVTTTAVDACIPPPGIQTPPSLPLRTAIVPRGRGEIEWRGGARGLERRVERRQAGVLGNARRGM